MRILSTVEGTLERWSTPLWSLLLPAPRRQEEVVRILRRHCDDNAVILGRHRTIVPNTFVVLLPGPAHQRLLADRSQVQRQLAVQVCRHAAENGYTFVGRVAVDLRAGTAMTARFRVHSSVDPTQR